MAGPHALPYAAQSGSTPRGPALSGSTASQESRPRASRSTRAAGTNGMSQATPTTGAGASMTAV